MFTGIVQALVSVAIDHSDDLSRLTLELGELGEGLQLGASVAVNAHANSPPTKAGRHTSISSKKPLLPPNLKHQGLNASKCGAFV